MVEGDLHANRGGTLTSAKIFRIFSIMQLLENIKNSGQKNS